MDIRGAVALVTGGSGGPGARICSLLADDGADVAVGYLHGAERAGKVVGDIEAAGGSATAVSIDQSETPSVEAAVAGVVERLGGLDILINNAGMATGGHNLPPGDLEALTPETWDQLMSANMRGPYIVARAAAPHLRASNWGRIVNIGSTLGHGSWYADRAFAPSKAAMVPLTRFLAASLAPEMTVNCVSPGLMVETGLGSGAPEELLQGWHDRAALGVTTSLDDVAGQVVQFRRASSTTGQAAVVDGGIHFS